MPTDEQTECPQGGKHEWECYYEDWETEKYRCVKCGERFTLYEEEMR